MDDFTKDGDYDSMVTSYEEPVAPTTEEIEAEEENARRSQPTIAESVDELVKGDSAFGQNKLFNIKKFIKNAQGNKKTILTDIQESVEAEKMLGQLKLFNVKDKLTRIKAKKDFISSIQSLKGKTPKLKSVKDIRNSLKKDKTTGELVNENGLNKSEQYEYDKLAEATEDELSTDEAMRLEDLEDKMLKNYEDLKELRNDETTQDEKVVIEDNDAQSKWKHPEAGRDILTQKEYDMERENVDGLKGAYEKTTKESSKAKLFDAIKRREERLKKWKDKPKAEEDKFGMGNMGGADLTVWDRRKRVKGDYPIVGTIIDGKISMNKDYKDDKEAFEFMKQRVKPKTEFKSDSLVAYRGGEATKEAQQGQAGKGIYLTTNSIEAKKYGDISEITLGKINLKIEDRVTIPMDNVSWNKRIREDGYDGILIREIDGSTDELVIFNKDKISNVKSLSKKKAYQPMHLEQDYTKAYDELKVEETKTGGSQGALFGQSQLFDTESRTELKTPKWAKGIVSDTTRFEDVVTALTDAKNGKHSELADKAVAQMKKDGIIEETKGEVNDSKTKKHKTFTHGKSEYSVEDNGEIYLHRKDGTRKIVDEGGYKNNLVKKYLTRDNIDSQKNSRNVKRWKPMKSELENAKKIHTIIGRNYKGDTVYKTKQGTVFILMGDEVLMNRNKNKLTMAREFIPIEQKEENIKERIKRRANEIKIDSERSNKEAKSKEAETITVPENQPIALHGVEKDITLKEATASRSGISFDPEKRGEQIVKSHIDEMTNDYEALSKYAKTEEQKKTLDDMFALYRDGIVKRKKSKVS